MDYLAYSSGGNRFRAVEEVKESGVLKLQNYINYEGAKGDKTALINYDKLFEKDKLVKLSEIFLENIKVN